MKNKLLSILSVAAIALTSIVSVNAISVSGNVGTFTNDYTPDYAYVDIEATKVLNDGTLEDGQFTFELLDEDGNVIAETTNDEDGNIVFEDVEFSVVDDYEYTIIEVDDEQDYITYDDLEITVYISVTYDEDTEALVAEVTYSDDVQFDNYYEAATPAVLQLTATKVLTDNSSVGRELEDEEFTFKVKDEDGTVVATGTNDEDGNIVFEDVEFSAAGTYEYTVYEYVSDEDEHITYDDTVYTVTVIATEEDGEIVLELDSIDS